MPNKIIQKLKNEDGAALVMAMMVLMVLSILGAMVGTLTVGSYRLSANNQDYNSAYYIAEAGANMAYEEIKDAVNVAYDNSDSSSLFFDKVDNISIVDDGKEYYTKENGEYIFDSQSGSHPKAIITVEASASDEENKSNMYTIQSVGVVDGKERIVEKTFQVSWVEKQKETSVEFPFNLKDSVITFNNKLNRKTHFDVAGKVRHDGTGELSSESGLSIEKDPSINWENYINNFNTFIPTDYDEKIEQISGEQSLNFNGNIHIRNLYLTDNTVISFEDDILNIVVENLYIDNQFESLSFLGDGHVNLFVTKNLSIHNGANSGIKFNQSGNSSKFNLFYSGNPTLDFKNGMFFYGGLFVKDKDLYIGNGSKIYGNIVSGGSTMEFDNNVEVYHREISLIISTVTEDIAGEISEKDLISTEPAIEN